MWRERFGQRRGMVARMTLDRYGLRRREGGGCQAREEQRFILLGLANESWPGDHSIMTCVWLGNEAGEGVER
jgi:hypothetical protein